MAVIIPQVLTDRSGAQKIDGSLNFDGSKSQSLTRTVGNGNRTTWTWSAWVKADPTQVNGSGGFAPMFLVDYTIPVDNKLILLLEVLEELQDNYCLLTTVVHHTQLIYAQVVDLEILVGITLLLYLIPIIVHLEIGQEYM